jgi:hypothetical protein
MKIKISNYTFNAVAKTITFTDYASISLDQVLLVTNVTDNIIIYNFAQPTLGGTVATNVLTLTYNTASMSDTDNLQIFFEDNVGNTVGDIADTPASSDTGSFSIVAFFKRLLQNITTILSRLPSLITEIPSDDVDASAIPVRALPMHVSRIGFTKVLAGVDTDWGSILVTGTGMAVNQTGGNLVITSGTTARAETIIRSLADWKGGIRLRARTTLSQRIVNNNFFVELVDVIGDGLAYTITSATNVDVTFTGSHGFTAQNIGQSMYLGAFAGTGTFLSGRYPIAAVSGNVISFTVSAFAAGSGTVSAFGWNYYQLQYQGTTATAVNFDTQRNGWASGATAATISTTASPGHLAVITGNDLSATLADQLVASSTTIAQTVRSTRAENVPDDVTLRLQIRIANGSTAPASTTTWTIGLISISNFANQDVVLQDVRPMTNAQGLPVEILRSASLSVGTVTTVSTLSAISAGSNAIGDVGLQYRSSSGPAGTPTVLNSPATPAVQTIKGSAGRLFGIYLVNSNAAARYLKIFNATAPTLGSASAVLDIAIPPNSASAVFIKFEGGIPFTTAITAAITGARGVTDNTGITLNDVTGFTFHA